ncbi:MAG TPA: FtsQ-type POTRA domain-containing protein [Rhizomicrobium sp.]|jgi:cell division protein FtsQ|nr:FtsQ-type POTRA domain-containing protein [Rhizomicrobium sp.]
MRSVKIDRKASRPRAKPGRGTARATRASSAPAKPFGRRKAPSNNIVARTFRAIGAWFAFRRPMLTLAAALLVAVLIAALFIGGYVGRTIHAANTATTAVFDDAGFGISKVHLAGNSRTPTASILAALGFELGQPIFGADIQTARQRLKKLDWVAEADVRRRYPDDISVRIVEKLPFAVWQAPDQKLWVVERDGGLITTEGVEEFRHLPLLAGAGGSSAAEIVDAVAQHRAVSARVKAYQRVSERRWNLILDDGVVVKLPEIAWQKELDTLERLIIDKGILEHDVIEIDLREASQIFFVLKSGEKTSQPRGNAA